MTATYRLADWLVPSGENRFTIRVPRSARRPLEFSCSRKAEGQRWRTRSVDRPRRVYFDSPEQGLADLVLGELTQSQYDAFGDITERGRWPDSPGKIRAALTDVGLLGADGDVLTDLGRLATDHIFNRPLGRSADRPAYRPNYEDAT